MVVLGLDNAPNKISIESDKKIRFYLSM
jgi:hypothetical protein